MIAKNVRWQIFYYNLFWWGEEIFVFVDAVNFKNKVEVPPHRNNQHLKGHDYACNHRRISIDNEMTTPKSFHDVTTATKNSA